VHTQPVDNVDILSFHDATHFTKLWIVYVPPSPEEDVGNQIVSRVEVIVVCAYHEHDGFHFFFEYVSEVDVLADHPPLFHGFLLEATTSTGEVS
jgi:hypothetical protein